MNRPKVSVVMPIYNVERYLEQCLDSVVNQTLAEIEIIAVNDGSPDACGEIVNRYAEKDGRVKAIHKANGGYGSAVNAGIDTATGQYLAIVETDDYIAPEMMEILYNQAVESGSDISRGSYYVVRDGRVEETCISLGAQRDAFNINEFPQFLVTSPAIWSAIYSLVFLRSNNIRVIDSAGASYQDVDFFVRTSVLARKISVVGTPLYYYKLDNPNSSTNSITKYREIFDNYVVTDSFMSCRADDLGYDVVKYYNKRKLCDYQWHFIRVKGGLKFRYARLVRRNIHGIKISSIFSILTFRQMVFGLGMSRAPSLYVLIYLFFS